ncbi:MAG: site-2 protease family protein [Planctomycetes bacterium]|nr:site-2 protease family protein [Planctomycetota bacterium]MCB9905141.1 site-2 protease family protein [Planctomycetota bacterium]
MLETSRTDLVLMGLTVGVLILSSSVHEFAHALVAHRCGDPTAYNQGRLTLDPLVHIDPFWSILVPIVTFFSLGFPFGGAKPVPVNPFQLRHPARDMTFVAIAGPISNLMIALLCMLIWKSMVYVGGMSDDDLAVQALALSVLLNILLAVFNMIPIPPLDGSRVLAYFLRGKTLETYEQLERFGILIIVGLLYFGALDQVLWPALDGTWDLLFLVTGGNWS